MRALVSFTTIVVVITVFISAQIAGAATIAHWSFSETQGGTAADSSVNNYNGTLSGGINTGFLNGDTGNTGWMTGGKLKLSSSPSQNNHVDTPMPLSSCSGANGFTAEAILTWTGSPSEDWSPIFGENTSDHNTNGIFFFGKQDGTNNININIAGINNGSNIAGTNLFNGSEHHVALVFDNPNNQTRVYVDYNLVATFLNITGTPTFSGVNVLRIGGNGHAGAERWIGNFNEARFSDTALAPGDFLVVPEPASLAMLAIAGLFTSRSMRRKASR